MDASKPVPKDGPSNENPVGEWNTYLTVCTGDTIKSFVNGKLMNVGTQCNVTSGMIGMQCEGAELEISKMFVEPLDR